MKTINTTVDLRKAIQFAENNFPSILFITLYLIGLIITVIHFSTHEDITTIPSLFTASIPYDATTLKTLICNSFIINLIITLLIIVLSSSAFGTLGMIPIMVFKGIHSCCLGLQIYAGESTNALKYLMLSYIPAEVFITLSLLCGCVQGYFLSKNLFHCMFFKSTFKIEIRTYLKRYILILLLQVFGYILLYITGLFFIN